MTKNFKRLGKNQFSYISCVIYLLMSISGVNNQIIAQDNISVLDNWLKYSDASNALYHHLLNEADEILSHRNEKISTIKKTKQWQKRQIELKRLIWEILGPFPAKTPLNAQIVDRIIKEDYVIENVIYESLPEFYVTASLFIPNNIIEPGPAILFCSGHSQEAYRKRSYQIPLLNLVKKGFIVLAIDPIGQGERLQYYDQEKGYSIVGNSTKEHSYPSVQVSLLGKSIARFFVWDGIRAIDYLVGRKEVDPNRIGVHGISGGGTQTAFISAVDDRVVAAAPACYITSFKRLIESIGVQDGEQNFYHGILTGIDHADFIEVRAPKPTLIMATTRDFFSIQGVRETFAEAKKVYDIFGKPNNIKLVEDDYEHGYTQKNREEMYSFFQKNLLNLGSSLEEDIEFIDESELQKTLTGQLATSHKSETVFSLNCKEAQTYIYNLQESRKNLRHHLQEVSVSAQRISGYKEPSFFDSPVFTGKMQKEGFVVEKYFIKGEGNYVIPYLLLIPAKPNNKSITYLLPKGKEAIKEIATQNEVGWLIEKGFTVLIPDLLGIGELGGGDLKADAYVDNVSFNLLFTALLIGRSIVGIQASDVVKLSNLLKQYYGMDDVYAIAYEEMLTILLHAVVFNSVVSRVALIKPYSSYRSFVMNRFYESRFIYSLVPGALTMYDLPDLAAAYAPAKLLIAGMTNCNGQFDKKEISKDLKIIEDAYHSLGMTNLLEVIEKVPIENSENLFQKWIN